MSTEEAARVEEFARARQKRGELWGWQLDLERRRVELFVNPTYHPSHFPKNIGAIEVIVTPLPAAKEQEAG